MVTGEVIHALASTDFSKYDYHAILIPNGVVATINGVALPSMAAPITLPMGISKQSAASGSIFLIGRKKFGETSGTTGANEDALSNDPGNTPGTFSIK